MVPLDGSNPPTPPGAPTDAASARLTVLDPAGRDDPAYDFHSASVGSPVTHVFTLRNDGKTSVVLDHLESACDCTSAIVLDDAHGAQPQMLPGATARVRVTLDTSKLAPVTAPGGSTVEKTVSVFLVGQPVHPAAVLRLTGRLTGGVAFDPPTLDLGNVEEAKGTTRLVRVTYDAGLYAPGRTRLASTLDGRLTVLPLADAPGTAPKPGVPVQKTYRVTVPPHAAVGPLGGTLAVTGLAGTAAAGQTPAAFTLPYAGEVRGNVTAEPGMVVFGLVPGHDRTGGPMAAPLPATRRVRWILLLGPSQAGAAKAPKKPVPPGFWRQARVIVDSPYFRAAVVSPGGKPQAVNAPKAGAPPATVLADPSPTPPDVSAADLPPGGYAWLRVDLLPTAPVGPPLSGQATVRLPGGETILLPIQAQVQ